MKVLAENIALDRIREIKARHREAVRDGYEFRAKDCVTCETKGACCLDAHFVNVRVSRLEAMLMAEALGTLPEEELQRVVERVDEAIERFGLGDESDAVAMTYACPLFEPTVGCLVHEVKPVPCVQHACYEKKEDLPPDDLGEQAEIEMDEITRRTYGKSLPLKSIPIAIREILD